MRKKKNSKKTVNNNVKTKSKSKKKIDLDSILLEEEKPKRKRRRTKKSSKKKKDILLERENDIKNLKEKLLSYLNDKDNSNDNFYIYNNKEKFLNFLDISKNLNESLKITQISENEYILEYSDWLLTDKESNISYIYIDNEYIYIITKISNIFSKKRYVIYELDILDFLPKTFQEENKKKKRKTNIFKIVIEYMKKYIQK